MLTAEQICNVALSYIGNRNPIDSIENDGTLEAEQCAIHYPVARDKLLSSRWWPFATRHQLLALLSTVRSGWAYAYAVPTDMLKARYIFAGARPGGLAATSIAAASMFFGSAVSTVAMLPPINGAVPSIPFEFELSDDGTQQIIVTDQDSAELVYTFRLTAVVAMPPAFQDALAWDLARRLARTLPASAALADDLKAEAAGALATAWSESMNDQQPDPAADSSFIAVRG